jgi:16S rRNA (uracil1498-N3)-methyltransferase
MIRAQHKTSRKGANAQSRTMTRRRFYAPPAAFAPDGQSVVFGAEETRHARDVLRLQRGDEVYVFDGAGREYRCAIAEIDRNSTRLNLVERAQPARPESPLKLTLAVALLKGERFDLVVQKATELGASGIVPLATARADARIRGAEDSARRVRRWRRIALEAAKQSGRACLIRIDDPNDFESFVGRTADKHELRLMFAERDGISFAELAASLASKPASITALVGSEGGWTDEEITLARGAGWDILTLGGRTLRAETAALAVTALLQHRFGDLV